MVKKPTKKEFKDDIQRLQFSIGQHLLNNRTRPIISYKIPISITSIMYLEEKYQLNYGRFKNCNCIFNDLKIINENVYNEEDFNSLEDFKLKFIKSKEKTLNLRNGSTQTIKSDYFLSVKFTRVNHIVFNQSDHDFLVNFAKN